MNDKHIMHLDLDTFYVSVERKIDSRLKARPLLVGGTSDRGVVAACSYETRGYGVHSGMSMKLARQLCPEAVVIRGNAGTYSKHSDEVTEIIKEQTPLFEKSSIDEFYADLTGMDRFYGCYKFATEMRNKIIKETGLPISFGLSINKVVSKIATGEAKPNNQLLIDYGTEKSFLAPLSIKKIPQVGDKTYQTLRHLGIKKIHTVQEMPQEMMINVLGKNGSLIWQRAQGVDNRPVVAFNERKSISTERTFDKDTIDIKKLKSILIAMTENLAYQLRRGDKLTACINVKIRYSDFNTYSKQMRIPYCSADHILIPRILELFDKLFQRRLLIRLIGIRFSHIVSGNYQINLFDDSEQAINLYNALDKIREKYGDRTVVRAAGMEAKTIGRMHNPFNGLPPVVLAHRKQ
ncbi:DNA polymerase-4 [Nonlabens dokdonensis]|uniref:DNA polymerase IV n=2 Tax=Nonlabens dokdonensis TaxID=328515 RepID=L7W909_NONDD|nr:DNA polymerase IV [Nonlabens dokdonensis]AGC76291.1 DNA-directed DNA polymerase, impB/mucB/samB family [Nonlabens dokdonensis DSW-6]PZX43952.1 DNA polymerase-4 [Nonlabens dokdonensis]